MFQLDKMGEVVVGRGGELDLVLVEDMVSRKHAMLTVSDDALEIEDLGSTNGTFVNGEKIKKVSLSEGDRVLIGTSILKVIDGTDVNGGGLESLQQAADRNRESGDDSATAMSGSLEDVAIPDLLQLFTTSRKTGVLSVANADEDSGRIYIREGQIFYAEYNDLDIIDPVKAMIRMMGWSDGHFRMLPPSDKEFADEIKQPSDHLIIEAARNLDELRRLEDEIPELEDMVKIPSPLESSLTDLSKEELQVFQLAFNQQFFQPILDNSPFSDLKTSTIARDLMAKGYLEVA